MSAQERPRWQAAGSVSGPRTSRPGPRLPPHHQAILGASPARRALSSDPAPSATPPPLPQPSPRQATPGVTPSKQHAALLSAAEAQSFASPPTQGSHRASPARSPARVPSVRLASADRNALDEGFAEVSFCGRLPELSSPEGGTFRAAVAAPGASLVWVGGSDGVVSGRDSLSGALVVPRAEVSEDGAAVNAMAFVPCGDTPDEVWVATTDGGVSVMEAATGRRLRSFATPAGILALAVLHGDGGLVLGAGVDGAATLWGPGAEPVRIRLGGGAVTAVCSVASGPAVAAAASESGAVALLGWVGPDLRLAAEFTAHEAPVLCMAHAPLGPSPATSEHGTLWSGAADGSLHVWCAKTGLSAGVPKPHAAAVTSIVCNEGEFKVWTTALDGAVTAWDPTTLAALCAVNQPDAAVVSLVPVAKAAVWRLWACGESGVARSYLAQAADDDAPGELRRVQALLDEALRHVERQHDELGTLRRRCSDAEAAAAEAEAELSPARPQTDLGSPGSKARYLAPLLDEAARDAAAGAMEAAAATLAHTERIARAELDAVATVDIPAAIAAAEAASRAAGAQSAARAREVGYWKAMVRDQERRIAELQTTLDDTRAYNARSPDPRPKPAPSPKRSSPSPRRRPSPPSTSNIAARQRELQDVLQLKTEHAARLAAAEDDRRREIAALREAHALDSGHLAGRLAEAEAELEAARHQVRTLHARGRREADDANFELRADLADAQRRTIEAAAERDSLRDTCASAVAGLARARQDHDVEVTALRGELATLRATVDAASKREATKDLLVQRLRDEVTQARGRAIPALGTAPSAPAPAPAVGALEQRVKAAEEALQVERAHSERVRSTTAQEMGEAASVLKGKEEEVRRLESELRRVEADLHGLRAPWEAMKGALQEAQHAATTAKVEAKEDREALEDVVLEREKEIELLRREVRLAQQQQAQASRSVDMLEADGPPALDKAARPAAAPQGNPRRPRAQTHTSAMGPSWRRNSAPSPGPGQRSRTGSTTSAVSAQDALTTLAQFPPSRTGA